MEETVIHKRRLLISPPKPGKRQREREKKTTRRTAEYSKCSYYYSPSYSYSPSSQPQQNILTTKVKHNSNCPKGSEAVPARPSRKARRRQSRALGGKVGHVIEIELQGSSSVTSRAIRLNCVRWILHLFGRITTKFWWLWKSNIWAAKSEGVVGRGARGTCSGKWWHLGAKPVFAVGSYKN